MFRKNWFLVFHVHTTITPAKTLMNDFMYSQVLYVTRHLAVYTWDLLHKVCNISCTCWVIGINPADIGRNSIPNSIDHPVIMYAIRPVGSNGVGNLGFMYIFLAVICSCLLVPSPEIWTGVWLIWLAIPCDHIIHMTLYCLISIVRYWKVVSSGLSSTSIY